MGAFEGMTICVAAPFEPPHGGIAIFARTLARRLEEEGARVIRIDDVHRLRDVLRYLWTIIDGVRAADLVHVITTSGIAFYRSIPAMVVSRILRKPVIVGMESRTPRFLRTHAGIAVPVLRGVSRVWAYTDGLADIYRTHGLPAIRIPTPGPDLEFVERRPLKPSFLTTKTTIPECNIEMAIRAFAKIQAVHPGATLTVLRTIGDEGRHLASLASELGLRSVHFHGPLPNEMMEGIYRQCDILLNPTNIDIFPVSLLEAFMSGTLVISTGVGGIPEMVEDGVNGVLVKQNDADGMARRALELLADQNKSSAMAARARERAESRFLWPAVRRQLELVYRDVGALPRGDRSSD